MPGAIDQDAFLAAALRNCKDKPQVDFKALAAELGMSQGGAQNKFREIMRKLEAEGPGSSSDAPKSAKKPATKTKQNGTPAKTVSKRKVPAVKQEVLSTSDTEDGVATAGTTLKGKPGDEVSDDEIPESPTKKQKTTKATSKTKKSALAVNSDGEEVSQSGEAIATKPTKASKAVGAPKRKATTSKTSKTTNNNATADTRLEVEEDKEPDEKTATTNSKTNGTHSRKPSVNVEVIVPPRTSSRPVTSSRAAVKVEEEKEGDHNNDDDDDAILVNNGEEDEDQI